MLHEHRFLNRLDRMNGDPTIHQQNKAKLIVDLQGQRKCVMIFSTIKRIRGNILRRTATITPKFHAKIAEYM